MQGDVDAAPVVVHDPCTGSASTQSWIDAVQLLRFPLGLAVVAVHAGEFVLNSSKGSPQVPMSGTFGIWVVEFLTLISRIATPSFLVIAGFVFFRDGRISLEAYRRKLKSHKPLSAAFRPKLSYKPSILISFVVASARSTALVTPL